VTWCGDGDLTRVVIEEFLPAAELESLVKLALQEDRAWQDVTSRALIEPDTPCTARIESEQEVVVAGGPVAEGVFRQLDPDVDFRQVAEEGSILGEGDVIAEVTGRAAALLAGERTALNFMRRLSGIATATHRCAKLVEGTHARIYDTRKTTPGLRRLEKYAVRVGGGCNHRMNLEDRVLIKDNHLLLFGGASVKSAVERARRVCGPDMAIEVEVEDIEGFKQALESSANAILLDNMSVEKMALAARIAHETLGPHRPQLEATGNIDERDVRAIAATGVDRISIGGLTHSVRAADISMEIAL